MKRVREIKWFMEDREKIWFAEIWGVRKGIIVILVKCRIDGSIILRKYLKSILKISSLMLKIYRLFAL